MGQTNDRKKRQWQPCPYPKCDGRIPCYPGEQGRYYCPCPDFRPILIQWNNGNPTVDRAS